MPYHAIPVADPDDREAQLRSQISQLQQPPDTGQSEREEALWCQVVLLKHRIDALEKGIALRDEMIQLQRDNLSLSGGPPSHAEVKARAARALVGRPRSQKNLHKCKYPECDVQVAGEQLYCSRSHQMSHRWEMHREQRASLAVPKPQD